MMMEESNSVEKMVFMAKLAEQTERYEEMKSIMKNVVMQKKKLSMEDRNLLSVAYKNVVGARRASWRVLNSMLAISDSAESRTKHVFSYKQKIEQELNEICQEVLELLDHLLKNKDLEAEESVFFHKMKGDYHRYMAEYLDGAAGQATIGNARDSYEGALKASEELATTNPIRLGLALNYSVFYYEILKNPERACLLAKSSFDDAVGDLELLTEEQYKDATLIMQLLRDNLTLWQTEGQATAMGKGGTVGADE